MIAPVSDGGAGVQLSNVADGTMISGLLGDWHVSFHLQVDGGMAWSSVGIVLRGGALALLGEGAELGKAAGYASLDMHAIIRFTSLTDSVLFSLNSNTALTMRSDAAIGMVRL